MKSFTGALFAAQVTAIKLQDAEFSPIFDPISPEHYMNANDLANFVEFSKEQLETHEQAGINETNATNSAIQTLLDYYNSMEASDDHFNEFGTKMVEMAETLENDLRVWWGDDYVAPSGMSPEPMIDPSTTDPSTTAPVKPEEPAVDEEAMRVAAERANVLTLPSGCVNPDTDWIYNAMVNPSF
jgi:hypothetical protein